MLFRKRFSTSGVTLVANATLRSTMVGHHPSFKADPTSCPGARVVNAAFIIAGQPRTFLEGFAQRGLERAIRAFGANAFTFAYLTDDDGGSSKGHTPMAQPNSSRVHAAIAVLRPKRVYYGPLVQSILSPPAGCQLSAALLAPYAGPQSKPTWRVWWETWEKLRRAYALVTEYERSRRFEFDWVVRLRPDIWFFGAPPRHCDLPPDVLSFPVGIVGCAPPCVNDHVAWVPRPRASAYFEAAQD